MINMIKDLKLLSLPLQKQFILSYFYSCISSLLQLMASLIVLPFINLLINQNQSVTTIGILNWFSLNFFALNLDNLVLLGILVTLFQLASSFSTAFSTYHNQKVIVAINHYFSLELLQFYTYQDLTYFHDKNMGEVTKSILQDAQQISTGIFQSTLESMVSISLIVLFIAGLFFVNVNITWILIGFLFMMLFLFMLLSKRKLKTLGMTSNIDNRLRTKYISEILNNLRLFKSYRLESEIINRYEHVSNQYKERLQKSLFYTNMPRYMIEAFTFSSIILVTLTYFLLSGGFTNVIPILTVYLVAIFRILPSIYLLSVAINKLIFSQDIKEEIQLLFSTKKHNNMSTRSIEFKESIVFDSVYFKYNHRQNYAIKNANFEIKKGEYIGIYGHSGAGKSTLIDLILKFISPVQGKIKLDAYDIEDYSRLEYLPLFAYVPQDTFILDGTLIENITFKSNNTQDEIDQVYSILKFINLYDFVINELPQGLNTPLGEKGVNLSGGQKQRISLARALYTNANILILDEATNALDNKTERMIFDLIYKLKDLDKTIIVISHRLENLSQCSKIYTLSNGTVKVTEHLKAEVLK